ncbi:MAG: hypothetical protein IT389_08455 [Nitrospira sp.]|nr:hypothetical protein [Nitrospira sp.]
MLSTITDRLAVSLPVIADFQGTLSRGITSDLGLSSLSFMANAPLGAGTPVSVLFHFGRDVAYMPLTGLVTAVTEMEETDAPTGRFQIDIDLPSLGEVEQRVLESAFQELKSYLDSLGAVDGAARSAARATLVTDNPRAILSLFITDNPYALPYRLPLADGAQTGSVQPAGFPSIPAASNPSGNAPATAPIRMTGATQFSWTLVGEGFILAAQLLRDLAIRFLPGPVARLFVTPITFAFIGHPRTLDDVPRKFPFARLLPKRLVDRWFRSQWPFIASYITGLTMADGTPTTGAMLISPLTTEQMIRNPRLARQRVLETVRLAEQMGATIAGLGAFTSIVTRDGRDLEGKVRLGLTTGNPHSAAIAVQNILEAAALTNLSLPHATAAIVGGAGSVGSACAKMLAQLVNRLIIIDIKKDALQTLVADLAGQPAAVEGASNLDSVREADIVIAATNNPYVLLTAAHLKPGAIVIDAAQPKNVSEEIPRQRLDVIVIESAVVQTPGVDVHFDLDLAQGEALGCLSETMILTAIGWNGHYSLGKADPSMAAQMIASGRSLGFRLARFRNSTGYVTEEQLRSIARARTA